MIDDEQAIAQVLGGNREAYRVLVERHAPALFRTVRNLIRDAAECEDLVQDVFLAAYTHLRHYDRGRSSFPTWLQTIARNKCLNALKKKRPVLVTTLPETADRRTPGLESVEEETLRLFDQALANLPFEQRTVFVLAEIQDLPLEEIGKIEGVKLGTVKSRLSRAREKLRAALRSAVEQP
jgi:RNA polymerase sigma-70 factor, ECF subfamily